MDRLLFTKAKRADIIEHERMRIRRLDTGARTRGIGTQVDTLA